MNQAPAGADGGGSAPVGSLNERATRVFEFLIELQRLRTKVVRNLDNYRSVMWYSALPSVNEIVSPHRTPESEAWLSVERVERDSPPAPPALLVPWIAAAALRDSSSERPVLSSRAVRAVETVDEDGRTQSATEEMLLDDHPEVGLALGSWLPEWTAWAEQDRTRAAVAEVYQQLYSMYQDSHALAETYETLLCFGYLTARSGGQDVGRHLITIKVVVELDLETGRLTVLPAPDSRTPALEQDMLDPADSAPDDVRQVVLDALGALDDPWAGEPDGVAAVLRTWVNGLSADATFSPSVAPHSAVPTGAAPAVSLAPALVLRERTQRSFIAACEHIVEALRAGAEVPSGVRQFVDITDGAVSVDEQVQWAEKYADAETYFPKASNDDQRQIVQRLAESQTVVVQGPPGTGKTHSIANLVTDLLAHGQRVLITSNTTRALRVLKGQLPEEISDLCVSVTDDVVKGQADLEHSVTTILGQADTWSAGQADSEATRLRSRLSTARSQVARALDELRTVREQETYEYASEIGDYQGTLQTIAARLANEEQQLGWIGTVLTEHPTVTPEEVWRYLDLLRRATPELSGLTGVLPPTDALPSPLDVDDLARRRADLDEREHDLAESRDDPRFLPLATASPSDRHTLSAALTDFVRRRDELARRGEPWVAQAITDVMGGRDRAWHAQHSATTQAVTAAGVALPSLQGRLVTGLDTLDLGAALGYVTALSAHLAAGKKLKGIFGQAKVTKDAQPFLTQVKVEGQPCETVELLAVVHSRIALERALRPAEQVWGLTDTSGHPAEQRVARLQDDVAVLAQVLEFAASRSAVDHLVHTLPTPPTVNLADMKELADLRRALDALELAGLQHDIEALVSPAVRQLRQAGLDPHAVAAVDLAAEALTRWDTDAYRDAFAALVAAQDANVLLGDLEEARASVSTSVPALAEALAATFDDVTWDDRLPLLEKAWAWAAWDKRIRAKTDPRAERHWRDQLSQAEVEERVALQRLASNRGWAHCLQRLTPHETTHLNMYALAVRKVGKGTGKYAARNQANARASLRQCQTAVPAWIMPMHQVFETVPVDRPNLFDVVIVDEASQSGLEGLLLSWLAPRLVIVGDDKQVSPSNVGLDHEAVYTLQDRYLAGIETKALFGPMNSFFDQAVGKSKSRIMLREHFRCMPEIIGFSNQLSYRGQLIPLRQYGADRLPPLRSTFVKGAMVSGRRDVVNEAEAQALVDQLAKCCADPAYDGKTMGVISLLGNAQDKLIMTRIVGTIGVREVEARRLRAGNAEAFQGDERHVMFISMVSSLQSTSGPASIGALSKESDQQRLNVAASRAQDQVWLFHSVHPGDLSTKDLRRSYLQYVIKPVGEQDALDIGEVSPDERHPVFDSLFEQRVFLALRERGYRVRPQVKVGRYSIDLVVEGGTQRLAVECDGDAFHGLEAEPDDAARQRDLERVGWTFWRVRGSAFFRDPNAAMEPLWDVLALLGIEPATWSDDSQELLQQEVHAPAAAMDAAQVDLVDLLFEPTLASPLPQEPSPPSARQTPGSEPELVNYRDGAVGAQMAPRARFRDGKILLTVSARDRVKWEVTAIEAWLADPPAAGGVDARSAKVQRQRLERLREEHEDRRGYLCRVLEQSIADPAHPGGQWVTPGCVVGLRFGDDLSVEPHVVSSMHEGLKVTAVSPFADLGRAIDGAELGAVIKYESPRGLQVVTVAEIVE